MSKTVLYFIIRFIILVIAQAVIFNNIVLFSVAVAFVFIYAIISMPLTWSTNVSVIVGFLLGLSVDVFSDTLGMNALSCTMLAFARKPIFHLYMQNDEDLAGMKPSARNMGDGPWLKYLLTMTLAYNFCFFGIASFMWFHPLSLLLRMLCSTAFTFIVIYALDSVFTRKDEKRL